MSLAEPEPERFVPCPVCGADALLYTYDGETSDGNMIEYTGAKCQNPECQRVLTEDEIFLD